jgi:hypothetical protein
MSQFKKNHLEIFYHLHLGFTDSLEGCIGYGSCFAFIKYTCQLFKLKLVLLISDLKVRIPKIVAKDQKHDKVDDVTIPRFMHQM